MSLLFWFIFFAHANSMLLTCTFLTCMSTCADTIVKLHRCAHWKLFTLIMCLRKYTFPFFKWSNSWRLGVRNTKKIKGRGGDKRTARENGRKHYVNISFSKKSVSWAFQPPSPKQFCGASPPTFSHYCSNFQFNVMLLFFLQVEWLFSLQFLRSDQYLKYVVFPTVLSEVLFYNFFLSFNFIEQ